MGVVLRRLAGIVGAGLLVGLGSGSWGSLAARPPQKDPDGAAVETRDRASLQPQGSQTRYTASLPFPGTAPGGQTDELAAPPRPRAASTITGAHAPLAPNTLVVADIAVEADYEFFQRIGGNMLRAQDYVRRLLAAVSAIYERDLHVLLRPSFIRIATTPDDPWSATTPYAALTEVQTWWTAHEAARPRTTVLFLSGKPLGGGMAYRPGICSNDYGYAVVGDIQGYFSIMPGSQTWDLVGTAHELGHNFGSRHSHCYTKSSGAWYDRCYNAENGCYAGSVVPGKGTLMSYCLSNPPYESNIDPLAFSDQSGDPAMVNAMRQTVAENIGGNPGGCLAAYNHTAYLPALQLASLKP